MRVLTELFKERGLPKAIRSDNGTPFASTLAANGLSRMAVWFIRLGIRPERIAPGCPQQNGRHERMHRTLGEAIEPVELTMARQQERFYAFRQEFNYERPHEALGMKCPGEVYEASPRPYPKHLPEPEYPSWNKPRRVDANGCISVGYRNVFVGRTLVNELVGLEPRDAGTHLVRFGYLELGIDDGQSTKLQSITFRAPTDEEATAPSLRRKN
jgi:hypothetical protein